MARLHKRYKRKKNPSSNPGPRQNPPLLKDLAEFIGPGFAAFAVSRFGTRIATQTIAKKKPTWGKHAGGIAAIGAFLAAWLLANRIKWLGKYQTPIAVGAAIAAAQSLIQLYIPRLGWMVSDASATGGAALPAATAQRALPTNFEIIDDDPSVYQYTDSAADVKQYGPGTVPQQVMVPSDEDVMEIDQDGSAEEMAGIFGAG